MSQTNYKYCIGAGAPLCNQCKRHRPYTQPNSPECKEWQMVEFDPTTGNCQTFDPKGGEWIKVSECLPPLGVRVLMCVKEPNFARPTITIGKRIPHDRTDPSNPRWHWSKVVRDTDVTHWQLLPKIPEL